MDDGTTAVDLTVETRTDYGPGGDVTETLYTETNDVRSSSFSLFADRNVQIAGGIVEAGAGFAVVLLAGSNPLGWVATAVAVISVYRGSESIGTGVAELIFDDELRTPLAQAVDQTTGDEETTDLLLFGLDIALLVADVATGLRSFLQARKLAALADDVAPTSEAVLGRKLDYLFGKATGRPHNIERSTDMLRQMERIGLPDTGANRQILAKHFQDVLNDASSVTGTGRGGITMRESLLMGPNGAVKIRSYWDGDTLLSFILEGVGSRFSR